LTPGERKKPVTTLSFDPVSEHAVSVTPYRLAGALRIPPRVKGVVVFAHGGGSSRLSPRNRAVARRLNEVGLATLLLDLLTPREAADRTNVFNIPLLADRVEAGVDLVRARKDTAHLPVGLFGSSTGAAAALIAAERRPKDVASVVSRGGRPDLAGERLALVKAPTLLVVGGEDRQLFELNRSAQRRIGGRCTLVIIPGATHLFEEPGALERLSDLAVAWFLEHAKEVTT
jgi:putative phosphoribosyl transferase